MEREIKFRGRRLDTGEWLYGDLCQNNYLKTVHIITEDDNYGDKVDPDTVGQFTGKQDKNGKDIYEGDILRSDYYPYSDEEVKDNYFAEVVWHEDMARFIIVVRRNPKSKVRGVSDGLMKDFIAVGQFEIVGNIYDAEELIGGEGAE